MRWIRARVAMVVVVTVAGLVACTNSDGEPGTSAPLPEGVPTITVIMKDFAFDLQQAVPAGRVVFRALNTGRAVHRLSMLPLSEDIPPIAEQLKGGRRRAISPFAGIYDRDPGEAGTFAVDLVRGRRYALVCFVNDDEGSHAVKGMSLEFRAGVPPGATTSSIGAPSTTAKNAPPPIDR